MVFEPSRLSVAEGLQAEQDLLASVCRGERPYGLLAWQPLDRALVMPRRMNRLDGFEAACQVLAESDWPVLLRETGGEPVPQSSGVINLALAYVAPRSEKDELRLELAYRRLCDPLCEVLEQAGGRPSLGEVEGAFCDGRFNVNLDGRKLVGTAQRWRQHLESRRPAVLVHGALLWRNERVEMVAAVNRFNERCDLPQRCRADSHVALEEVLPGVPLLEALVRAYDLELEAIGQP